MEFVECRKRCEIAILRETSSGCDGSAYDLAKVHILESIVRANGDIALPTLRADIRAITTAATRLGDCRLIVIDPVSAYYTDILNVGRTAGFTRDTLRRAKERIGASAYRDGFGPGSRFYWQLTSASSRAS